MHGFECLNSQILHCPKINKLLGFGVLEMTDAALCCNVFEHMFLEQLFSFSKCWFIFFNSQTIYAFVLKNSNKFKDLAGSSVRFSKAQ